MQCPNGSEDHTATFNNRGPRHCGLKSQGSARECKGLSDVVCWCSLLMKMTQECSEIIGTANGCNLTISRGLLLHAVNGTRKWSEHKYHDSLQIVDKRVRYSSRKSFFSPLTWYGHFDEVSWWFALDYKTKYVFFNLRNIR